MKEPRMTPEPITPDTVLDSLFPNNPLIRKPISGNKMSKGKLSTIYGCFSLLIFQILQFINIHRMDISEYRHQYR